MKKIKNLLLILVCAVLVFAPSYVNAEPETDPTPTPSESPEPTTTPEPTQTPEPTEEPKEDEEEKVEITLNSTELELGTGKEATLKATIKPSDDEIELKWSSSKENIATVKDGVVTTGNSAGETIITVEAIKDNKTLATATCTITVSRTVGKEATLKNLDITNGKISPEFKSDVDKYNVTLNEGETSLDIEYELTDKNAKPFPPSDEKNKNLKNGDKLTFKVVAEDGKTEKSYTLTIVKNETSIDLKSLKINGYALNESFDPKILEYTASIPYEIETISVTASPEDSDATVKVTGLTNLKIGKNTVTISVKDKDGNTNTYKIVVTRETEVSVEENATSIITSSDVETNTQTSSGTAIIPKNDNNDDNFLKYAIVSIACLILFAIGGIGIYFYLKTSPKKLKKELESIKNEESPIVEVENDAYEDTHEDINQKQESIEKVMKEDLVQTKEFNMEKEKFEDLFDD